MRVRTALLTAMVIAPVAWGLACSHDGDAPKAPGIPPEAPIYEPGTAGQASLVGVEYIVPFAVVPKTSPPPELFGRKFTACTAEPRRSHRRSPQHQASAPCTAS